MIAGHQRMRQTADIALEELVVARHVQDPRHADPFALVEYVVHTSLDIREARIGRLFGETSHVLKPLFGLGVASKPVVRTVDLTVEVGTLTILVLFIEG